MNKIKELLKKLGFSDADITKLIDDATNADFKVEDLVKGIHKQVGELLQEDPEFIKPLTVKIEGEQKSKLEHKLKKAAGLTAEEVKDKKLDEIVDLAVTKLKVPPAGNDDLQKELLAANAKIKKLEEEDLPGAQKAADEKITGFQKTTALLRSLGTRAEKMLVGPDVVLPGIAAKFERLYNMKIDESGNVEVLTKDGTKPMNSDKTKVLGFEDLIDAELDFMKVLKQSNGGDPDKKKTGATIENDPDKPKFVLPGMKKAQQNAEDLKKMKTLGNEGN